VDREKKIRVVGNILYEFRMNNSTEQLSIFYQCGRVWLGFKPTIPVLLCMARHTSCLKVEFEDSFGLIVNFSEWSVVIVVVDIDIIVGVH
jgi:hypothetical protein